MTRPNSARLVLSPLLLLVALLTTLGIGTPSAAAASGPETRVRAIPTATAQAVGQSSSETPASVGCLRPAPTVLASGSCVATEAGSIRGVNPLGGTNNCVNCAVATDATLSGAPSSALNVAPGVSGQPISILEDLYGGAFKPVSGQAGIESILTEAGSGSRGIVFGARGNDVGHVFNAVNQNGTIRFLDGQTGGVASFKGYTDFWFLVTG